MVTTVQMSYCLFVVSDKYYGSLQSSFFFISLPFFGSFSGTGDFFQPFLHNNYIDISSGKMVVFLYREITFL